MKRLISIMFIFAAISAMVFAQDDANQQEQQLTESLTNYLIDDFEFANTWTGNISRDLGVITLMRREGGPADVVSQGENNKYILGAKVEYFKTSFTWFSILPPRKIRIPGTVKELSVWVAGRNYNHTLSFYIYDVFGQIHKVGGSKLNYIGWKNLTAYVSPNIPQENIYSQNSGIDFMGMQISCSPNDARGKYFIYFDNIMAKTDVYLQTYSDVNDPKDIW